MDKTEWINDRKITEQGSRRMMSTPDSIKTHVFFLSNVIMSIGLSGELMIYLWWKDTSDVEVLKDNNAIENSLRNSWAASNASQLERWLATSKFSVQLCYLSCGFQMASSEMSSILQTSIIFSTGKYYIKFSCFLEGSTIELIKRCCSTSWILKNWPNKFDPFLKPSTISLSK